MKLMLMMLMLLKTLDVFAGAADVFFFSFYTRVL